MAGIKELKDAVRFGAKFGNALGLSLADNGKIDLGDIGNFIEPFLALPEAIAGIDQIPVEISDIDAAELAELQVFVQDEFDIPQDGAEEFIEDALNVTVVILQFVDKHFL